MNDPLKVLEWGIVYLLGVLVTIEIIKIVGGL